jgi:hypothetical protein
MTRNDFEAKCKAIMTSRDFTDDGKRKAIESAAESFLDYTIEDDRKILALRRKEEAIERRYSRPGCKPFYCSECSTWHPKEPSEIAELDDEFDRIKAKRKAELVEAAIGPGKAV